MKALFGIPIETVTLAMVILLGVALAVTAFIAISNRTMFRMGTRNLLRRRIQSALIVFGLMLSTLIVTAAFVTGDTIDHSLTSGSYQLFQRSDLDVSWNGERNFLRDEGATDNATPTYIDESIVDAFEQTFAGNATFEAFLPWLYVLVPATNPGTGDASPAIQLVGYDTERFSAVGGLQVVGGGTADLAAAGSDAVFVSSRAARDLDLQAGDTVRLHGPAGIREFRVAAIVEDELASGVLGIEYTSVPGGIAMPIESLRAFAGFDGNEISALTVALRGDAYSTVELGDEASALVAAYIAGEGQQAFADAGLSPTQPVITTAAKVDSVEQSEATGNLFVTFFIVLGLFSVAAGVLLIFMILVMLASERRPEMGMARAVGAQRKHLLQAFIAEGMAYSLLAGTVGVVFGVLASLGMTNVLLPAFGGDYFSIVEPKVTWQAIVIGYSLGVVVTFFTVVLAAMRVTHVNIVAAIRSLPESTPPSRRRRTNWKWVALSVPAMVVPPLGLWWLLRKGFGISKTWILGPAGMLSGVAFILLGLDSEMLFSFGLGVSLIPLSLAAMVLRLGLPPRTTWTGVGLLLLAYWLLPPAQHAALFGEFDSNIEMFIISGLMIVIGATLIISFNARMLTSLFTRAADGTSAVRVPAWLLGFAAVATGAGIALGDSADGLGQLFFMVAVIAAAAAACAVAAATFAHLAPALKMAIAYPMANRSRTGMTIAMFSLIVFSLTVFSILIANFSELQGGDETRGNVDVIANRTGSSDVGDIVAELREFSAAAAGLVEASGGLTLYKSGQEARLTGNDEWLPYPVIAADDEFLGALEPSLDSRAYGYGTDAAVFEAVRNEDHFALVDLYGSGQGFSEYEFTAGIESDGGYFEPLSMEVRDAATGEVRTVTIIGVLRIGASPAMVAGVYLNERAYSAAFGTPDFQREYIRLADGADSRELADAIEAALATRGVKAQSVEQLLAAQSAQMVAFNRMFQAFMALGLVVGIAGLGVISFRSVVERRQQIGMLRAIGFQRGTVALTFLVESGFIAVMGILSGVVCGTILARNLLTSKDFTEGAAIEFAIPWGEVSGLVVASLVVSLLMTWWPSRGAARVPVAEALRYE